MIIVINLLKPIFIVFFMILLILEIFVLLAMIFLSQNPITTNFEYVQNSVKSNSESIIQSLSFLVMRKLNSIQLQLFLVGKHLRPFSQAKKIKRMKNMPESEAKKIYEISDIETYIKKIETTELLYNLNSNFIIDFLYNADNVIAFEKDNKSLFVNTNLISELDYDTIIIGNVDMVELFKKSIPDPKTDDYSKFIEETDFFNKVSYFQTAFNKEKINEAKSKNIFINIENHNDEIAFWTIAIKSLYVSNLMNIDIKSNIKRYMIFLKNGDLVIYPPHHVNSLLELPYLNTDKTKECLFRDYKICFSTFENLKRKNILQNQIYFDQPIITKQGFIIRACMTLSLDDKHIPPPEIASISYNADSVFCIDFSFEDFIKDIHRNIDNENFFFFFSNVFNDPKDKIFEAYVSNKDSVKTINNLDVFFSSKNNLTDIDYKKYKSTILKTHSLPDDNLKRITLFHGIYYNLFDFFNQITYYSDIIDTLLNEYKTIISSINKSIKILDSKNCSEIISSQEREDVDITHTQTSIHLGSWRKEPRLSKESFTLSSVPIYVNNTIYDEVHFTYNDEECNRYILFYMFSFTIRGNELLHNRIYFVYLLKLMRNYFLFSSSILFLVVLFYISMEIIAKYLIEPIKHVKKLMLKLIRDHGFSEEDLDSDQKINAFGFFAGVIGKNISPEENKLKLNQNLREFGNLRNNEDNDKEDELGLYANVETYELEELLNFLKKIIMMKTSGNVDYKERSRIYNRFLSFLDDLEERDYYRQCLNIIAYSKYKEQKYDEALVNLKDLLESAKNDEKELLLKCDKFENKIIKLPLIFKMPYVNDFTDNKFYLFPINTQKILKIRILKQKILYFAGLLCFLEYKNHKVQSKKELLVEGLIYLKESLQINQTLGTNHLKNIFTLILISKLYYKLEDYNNALINIKDALVKFIELNNYFFDKKLEEVFDSRIIFIIVNIVFEQIFSLNASICNKIGKKQLSALIYNNLLSKCFFISRDVHIDIFHKLNIFLFEPTNRDIGIHEETESSHDASKSEKKGTYKLIAKKKDSEFYKKLRKSIILDNENKDSFYKNIDQIKNFNSMSKETKLGVESKFEKARYMFYKSCNRKSSISKFLFILVSETLLNQFISNFEMKEVILKSIKKYLNLSDLIAYASFDQEILNYISGSSRDFNYKQFEKNKNFFACSEGYNNAKEKKSIFETLQFAYEKMIGTGGNDQYIFIFCLSNEFKFDSEEEARQLIKMGLHYKTTIYLFVFDYEVKKKRVDKLLVYLSNFVEAYLVIVKNFKIIEEAFQNISILGDQSNKRNILSYTYENHNYILGGLGKTYYINEN